jgi:holo-[acyl-carrier protein] synthase
VGSMGELQRSITSALDEASDPAIGFLGLGVDVVKIDRLARDRDRWGTAFLQKTFTTAEVDYCSSKNDSDACFAGTFAAKEAVFKALALEWTGPFTWRWVEIQRDSNRRPSVVASEQLLTLRNDLRSATIAVSITHAGEYAAAVALLTKV